MRPFALGWYAWCCVSCAGCATGYDEYEASRSWQNQHRTSVIADTVPPISHVVWVAPDDRPGDVLVGKLDAAKRKIDLNVYLLSDAGVIDSLVLAHRRLVPVRVILERSVYGNPKGNTAVFSRLQSEGVPVVWAEETRQNFNHAKYAVIDDSAYIATSNFSVASFTKNREFLVETSDTEVVAFMNALFEADYMKFPFL